MGTRTEPDLNARVAAWRQAMAQRKAFDEAALDELESHLWDEIDRLLDAGVPEHHAVLQASLRLGHADVLAHEYRKVTEWSRTRRPVWQHPYWMLVMWKNYFKIAFCNLRKQAGYSFINIGGLGLGLACAFMIVLFVQHELSYDAFHANKDRLYRLYWHVVEGEFAGNKSVNFATGYAAQLEPRYPEFESLILYDVRTPYLKVGSQSQRIGTVGFMSRDALDAFTFPLRSGSPETALDDPYSILLTEKAATALFGDKDPLGQQLGYNDDFDLTVTGILEDLPPQSHFQFEALAPIDLMQELMGTDALEDFTNYNYELYALLSPDADPEQLESKFYDYLLERAEGDAEQAQRRRLELQRITEMHFATDMQWSKTGGVDLTYIYLFLGIGLLILTIAGVNFMNLATARAAKRAKEVGVRKTVGAQRGQLTAQFLGESLLLSVFAVLLGLVLTALCLPLFSDIIGSELSFSFSNVQTLGLLIGIGLVAGLLAGIYPAFYLAAFRPALVLKGEVAKGRGAAALRKGLIVLQFGISVFLIISTLTVYNQLRYLQSQALGFEKEQVVFAPITPPIQEGYDAFRETVLQNTRVLNVTQAGGLPGRVNTSRGYFWPGQSEDEVINRSMYTVVADYDYLETMGLTLLAGRDFSRDRPADFENTYILNETAARDMGYADPADAIGQPFRAWDREMGEIIGVVADFHYQSLHQEIGPVVINIKPWISYVAFRLAPGDAAEAVTYLQTQWQRFAPGFPFDYRFLDEDFDRLYRAEQDLGQLFTFFACIAIFVACLGLFGLAAYSAEQRTKEIGIRKVLGASVRSITLLLSREFTTLVLIAFVLAAPVAFFVMNGWLDDFAYRTSVGVGTFALAAALALTIAWLTVSYQAIKAAIADPVTSLRYE